MTEDGRDRIGIVVIGRNEGARLVACLDSLGPARAPVVYVDSGSTDGSVEAAAARGAMIERLDPARPFTAAAARNRGHRRLAAERRPDFIQFIDGDCTLVPGWLDAALAEMARRPRAAVVAGRRREIAPDASIYNRMCDIEWDTPVGEATACGGDALIRAAALGEVGGFRDDLIAGEEPELCLRLRRAGWTVWRIEAEMTRHDAAMTRFGQWWRRCRRAGHAAMEGALLHWGKGEGYNLRRVARIAFWGGAGPLIALAGALVDGRILLALLIYPAQVVRLAARERALGRDRWAFAVFNTLGKFAEFSGVAACLFARIARRPAKLIEYK